MSEPPASSTPSGRPSRDDLLVDAVEDFVRLRDAADPLADDLDGFVGRYPEGLREELRLLCAAHDAVVGELCGPEASQAGDSGATGDAAGAGATRRIGDFQILDELGRGGMGVVYLAEQVGLKRRVALKVLAPSFAFSRDHKERFRREAAAAASLQHRGIVPIHAFGEMDGTLYYAMEYVPGRDLGQLIDAAREAAEQGRPRLGLRADAPYAVEVAELIARVADALHYAHQEGIVHRDVKPSNILLGADHRPRVLDFGLAKNQADVGDVTRSGDLTGTPYYMSPEQTLARRAPIDHRTDLFSLGVILYELCTFQRPFQGQDLQSLVFQICFGEPRPILKQNPDIPRDLAVVCAKALEKDPRQRYATAAEFAADLRRFTGFRPVLAQPASLMAKARKWTRRHRGATVAALGLAAVGLLLLGWRVRAELGEERQVQSLLVDAATHVEAGALDEAEADLRRAEALRPLDVSIQQELEDLGRERELVRQSREYEALRAERELTRAEALLKESTLELERDPELALALALEGAELARQGANNAPIGHAAVLAALEACVRSHPLGAADAELPHAVELIPGGTHAVLGGSGGVSLWSLTGEEPAVAGHVPLRVGGSNLLALSVDGTRLAVAEDGEGISIWSAPELAPVSFLESPVRQFRHLALSAGGDALAVVTGRLRVVLYTWTEEVWSEVWRTDTRVPISVLRFAPGGERLLVQQNNGAAWVVGIDGTEHLSLPPVDGPPLRRGAGAIWTPDGRELVQVEAGRQVTVRESQEPGAARLTIPLSGSPSAHAISPDGASVALGFESGLARSWSLEDGKEQRVLAGPRAAIRALRFAGSGDRLVLASDDRAITVFELRSGRELLRLPQGGLPQELFVSEDGRRILCKQIGARPLTWDLGVERAAWTLPAHRGAVRSAAFAPDGRTLLTTGNDRMARAWDPRDGTLRAERLVHGLMQTHHWTGFEAEGQRVRILASARLTRLALDDLELLEEVSLLPSSGPAPGAPTGRRSVPRGGVRHASFSPVDGSVLAVFGGAAYRVSGLEALGERSAERVLDEEAGPLLAAVEFADRSYAVLRERGVLELHVGDAVEEVALSLNRHRLLAFDGSNHRLALAGEKGFEVVTTHGERLTAEVLDGAGITALTFSQDGQHLLLGREQGQVDVWDVDAQRYAFQWRPHAERVQAIDVSPDGRVVATTSDDHTVKLWPLDPFAAAQEYGARELTLEERARFRLLDDVHREVLARVDALYDEHVLTRDVLTALEAQADEASAAFLQVARAYAVERLNEPANALHEDALRTLLDARSEPRDCSLALNRARAAARLEPHEAGHRLVAGLGFLRAGEPADAVEAIDTSFGLGESPREALGWAVRSLALRDMGRDEEAGRSLARMEACLAETRGRRGQAPPGGRPGGRARGDRRGRVGGDGDQHWFQLARERGAD